VVDHEECWQVATKKPFTREGRTVKLRTDSNPEEDPALNQRESKNKEGGGKKPWGSRKKKNRK